MLYIVSPLMLVFLFSDFIKKSYFKYFPTCVFYWSDFVDKYDRMKKNRNLIMGFVFGSLFIGIVINLFSNYLWDKITK